MYWMWNFSCQCFSKVQFSEITRLLSKKMLVHIQKDCSVISLQYTYRCTVQVRAFSWRRTNHFLNPSIRRFKYLPLATRWHTAVFLLSLELSSNIFWRVCTLFNYWHPFSIITYSNGELSRQTTTEAHFMKGIKRLLKYFIDSQKQWNSTFVVLVTIRSQSFLVLTSGTLQIPAGSTSSFVITFNQFWHNCTKSYK